MPHNLHLSQPTQSMILVTFLKWFLNSCFKTYVSPSVRQRPHGWPFTYVGIISGKHQFFIKFAHLVSSVDDVRKKVLCLGILFVRARRTVIVCRQVRTKARNCSHEENSIEVHLLQSVGVGTDSIYEALEVRCLQDANCFRWSRSKDGKSHKPMFPWSG